jgi:hypothetical protein
MKANLSAPEAILCEIVATSARRASALAAIVSACALDVGQPLTVSARTRPPTARASSSGVLTLHLPAALAAAQHPVWCLACRLACFCPTTRVSVLVRCECEFSAPRHRSRRRAA